MRAQLSQKFLLPPPKDAQRGACNEREAHEETRLDAGAVAISDDGSERGREILDKVKTQRDTIGYPISLVGLK